METQRVRQSETKVSMDGLEVVREYFNTGQITFGSSQLNPGQTGDVDPGHAESQEVFFVSRGTVLLRIGETYLELHEGDAALVPPNEPHQLTNIGLNIAIVTWSMAPSDN